VAIASFMLTCTCILLVFFFIIKTEKSLDSILKRLPKPDIDRPHPKPDIDECAVCGGIGFIDDSDSNEEWQIVCSECKAYTPINSGIEETISDWNRGLLLGTAHCWEDIIAKFLEEKMTNQEKPNYKKRAMELKKLLLKPACLGKR